MTDFILQIPCSHMENKRYSIVVRPYTLGQYRIQLCDSHIPIIFPQDDHGEIVRELCTYSHQTMTWAVSRISTHPDPIERCCMFENENNCEKPGFGRIRLDQ